MLSEYNAQGNRRRQRAGKKRYAPPPKLITFLCGMQTDRMKTSVKSSRLIERYYVCALPVLWSIVKCVQLSFGVAGFAVACFCVSGDILRFARLIHECL